MINLLILRILLGPSLLILPLLLPLDPLLVNLRARCSNEDSFENDSLGRTKLCNFCNVKSSRERESHYVSEKKMQYRGICSQFRGLRDDACTCLANSADPYGTGSLFFAFVFMAMLFLMPRLRKMVLKVLKSVQRML